MGSVRSSISSMSSIDDTFFRLFTEMYNRYLVVGGMPKAVKTYFEFGMFTGLP